MLNQIAELEARLAQAQTEIEKIDALNDLAWEVRYFNPERTQLLSEQARELATTGMVAEEAYLPGLAASLRTISYLNSQNGNFSLALTQSFEALVLLKNIPNSPLEVDVLCTIGWAYHGFGDYEVALDNLMKALALAREFGDIGREARTLRIIASVYADSNNLEEALNMELKSLGVYQRLGQKDNESVALNNLAITYLQMGNHDQALQSGLASLKLAEENNIAWVMLSAKNTMGEVYLAMEDYAQAMTYFQRALSMSKEQGSTYDEFYNLFYMGKTYSQQKNFDQALTHLHQSLDIVQKSENRSGQFQCHELLAEVYENQGNLTKALAHWRLFHSIKESVFNENSAKRLANLQVLHQVETAKRDAEIYHLRNEELLREIEERKKAEKTLEEMATTDPLTGLFNRRHFFNMAEFVLAEATRYNHPLSVMILDIDYFKQVNDTYGHAIGDEAIKLLSATIKLTIRAADVATRFGGDEFVLLMPQTNTAQAVKLAQRLRLSLTERTIPASQFHLRFTVSIGVSSLIVDVNTVDKLLECADRALYAAKNNGRNQVRAYLLNTGELNEYL